MISRLVPNGLELEGEGGWRARWSCSSQMTHELEEVANSAGHLSQEFKAFWRYSLTHRWQTQRRTDGLWSDKPSKLRYDKEVQGKLWNLGVPLFFSALSSLPAFLLAQVIPFLLTSDTFPFLISFVNFDQHCWREVMLLFPYPLSMQGALLSH